MQLKSIKTPAEAPFACVEFIKVDNAITEVVIGGKLRIRKGESYSANLQVLVEADGEPVRRHRVEAKLDGFAPSVEFFENSYDATERARHFEKLGAEVSNTLGDFLLKDSGEIVPAVGEATPAPELADLPF